MLTCLLYKIYQDGLTISPSLIHLAHYGIGSEHNLQVLLREKYS